MTIVLFFFGSVTHLVILRGLGRTAAGCSDTVLLRLGSTHADTNCPRADCVSSWTMVLIGMGVSYGVGTRVFVW